jgi:hypothetical protein
VTPSGATATPFSDVLGTARTPVGGLPPSGTAGPGELNKPLLTGTLAFSMLVSTLLLLRYALFVATTEPPTGEAGTLPALWLRRGPPAGRSTVIPTWRGSPRGRQERK